MSSKIYQRLSRSTEGWLCPKCVRSGNTVPQVQQKNQNPSYTIDDVMKKLLDMEKNYNSLFQKYEQQVQENLKLKEEIAEIKVMLNRNEQKVLNKNLIIHGIPQEKNESLKQIIEEVGNQLQVNLANSEFTAYRMGKPEDKKRPIKACFENETFKNQLIKTPKKYDLNAQTLGFRVDSKIFLNHDLTKPNLELYKRSLAFKKTHDYKYLWINNGNILLRKREDSVVKVIKKDEDLK